MTQQWAPEAQVWLEINGRRRVLHTATPDDLHALAAGFLLTEGYITRVSEIAALDVVREPAESFGIRASVPETGVIAVGRLQRHIRENGCGLTHFFTCDVDALRRHAGAAANSSDDARAGTVPAADFAHLFRAVFAAADEKYPDGGMHSVAITDGTRVLHVVQDVARHSAVDKALGRALLDGTDLHTCGILLTARVSGAIALKCARSGIGWVASRSIPTTLAAAIAVAARLPIVARAPGKDASIVGIAAES